MKPRPMPAAAWQLLYYNRSSVDRNVAILVAWGVALPEQGISKLMTFYGTAATRRKALQAAIARAHKLFLSSSPVELRLTKRGVAVGYVGVEDLFNEAALDPARRELIEAWASFEGTMARRVLRNAQDPKGWTPDEGVQEAIDLLTERRLVKALSRRVFVTLRGQAVLKHGELYELHALTRRMLEASRIAEGSISPAATSEPATPARTSVQMLTPDRDARTVKRKGEALSELVHTGGVLARCLSSDKTCADAVEHWNTALADCRWLGLVP